MSDATKEDAVPLTISVETAGVLLGLGRQSAYSAMWRDKLPTIDFGGRRKYVPVQRLAEMVGRAITAGDIARANTIVKARKCARVAA